MGSLADRVGTSQDKPWSVNVTSEHGPERVFTVWAPNMSVAFSKARKLYKLERGVDGIQLSARLWEVAAGEP